MRSTLHCFLYKDVFLVPTCYVGTESSPLCGRIIAARLNRIPTRRVGTRRTVIPAWSAGIQSAGMYKGSPFLAPGFRHSLPE
jgi:hypothetical protein